jgi:hypothetical protein
LGYGLARGVTLLANISGASTTSLAGAPESYNEAVELSVGLIDFGARYSFRTGPNRVVPFVQGTVTKRSISFVPSRGSVDDLSSKSDGFSITGGLAFFASPELAVELALTSSGFPTTTWTLNGRSTSSNESDGAGRVRLGVAWYVPRAKKSTTPNRPTP